MIRFEDISFAYPGQKGRALDHVELSIPQGSLFALLGPNGAGKSTLLRVLCGRLPNHSGTLHIPEAWHDAHGLLDPQRFGMLIENPGVYNRLSVDEYLRFFGSFYQIADLQERIAFLAHRLDFGSLAPRMNALSLGMRQKVQMMRTLLHRPPLVLLDEPTSNLDPIAREAMWSLVQESNKQDGSTFIVCSHLLGELESHCSHAALLYRGSVRAAGTLASLRGRADGGATIRIRIAGTIPKGISLPVSEAQKLIVDGEYLQYECLHPEQTNPAALRFLLDLGLAVVEVSVMRDSLGDAYRKLMEDQ